MRHNFGKIDTMSKDDYTAPAKKTNVRQVKNNSLFDTIETLTLTSQQTLFDAKKWVRIKKNSKTMIAKTMSGKFMSGTFMSGTFMSGKTLKWKTKYWKTDFW